MEKIGNLEIIEPLSLKSSQTIFDALKLIDVKQWMIVTVVNEDGKLEGVASPGDLRKAILDGQDRDVKLSEVMTKDPVVIREKDLKSIEDKSAIISKINDLYGQAALYAYLPVINEDDKVLGLVNVKNLQSFDPSINWKYHRKKVLVVGGAGYIGSSLVRDLLALGWSVRVLDKLLYGEESVKDIVHEDFELVIGDAGNIDDIVRAVEGVDAVVYLAELVGDPACSVAPKTALKTNYLSVTAMAHLCSHLNINRFIYTSSCSVYGASEDPEQLLNEESALCPVSLYARMKMRVEESILSVSQMPNPLFAPTILRLATVFGHSYRPRFDLVVNTFARNAISKGKIEIHGGNQWRPNVHVKDVGQAIIKVLEAPIETVKGKQFNVGSNENNHTITQLGEIAQEVFPEIDVQYNNQVVDARNYRVDFSKIEEAIGYKAQISVKDGMQEIKQAYEDGFYDAFDPLRFSNVQSIQELNYK